VASASASTGVVTIGAMHDPGSASSRADRLATRRHGQRRRAIAVGAGVAAVVAVLGIAALTGGDDGDGVATGTSPTTAAAQSTGERGTTTASAGSSTTAPSTTTTEARNARGSGKPVTFAFGGDSHFESYLRAQLDADPQGMLAPIAPVLSGADVAVVNLETALTERGEPQPKEFTFRAPPSALTALGSAGVDVASIANNHGLDYGPVGIDDAISASSQTGVPLIGIGHDAAEAYRPFTTTVKGQRIAVIGATQVLDNEFISSWTATDSQGGLASAKEVERLVAEVERARKSADTIVVFLHWGIELQTCPSGDQQSLARTLVDAGADIVVGGHSHRLQGAGWMDRAFVGYGLGNFIWYSQPGASSETGVLLVTAVGRDVESYQFVPAQIEYGVPTPLSGDAAASRLAAWESLRGCTGLAAQAPTD
jgi:poly-gamma-glutamate synthesis protein (capsule biosynthesis protein)